MTTKAASLVTQAKQWATNYGAYSNGEEGHSLTAPLRVRANWDAGDADAVAAMFTDNGSMLMGDEQLKGREEIRSWLAEAFAGPYKGSRLRFEPVEIKLLHADCAFMVAEGGFLLAGEDEVAPERSSRITFVSVRADGDWRVLSYQSSPVKG
ncbi:SgcJ/EcaC family oxidoreductase [Micromonospora sp. NPDC047707]|uniref:SgcJ/EcaC family oxidoreductase n=1 Tax=Micromonospora sp. NPDC047707 TaxID=3154498 RepID=UPI00345705EE